ncbi:hypothetical protein H072_2104 [Dactylellina haptotyla CBS 200.50]|uniref:Delta(24)-sterol reductase n=1 Tax=Dactylellina haptotyla (strain CBS 200.50) TaxID=1284197 RepID=S8AM74_DACHA|nr:hypothetical protein H072_2104 [Dactylellina haptotyla CBS 200.50]
MIKRPAVSVFHKLGWSAVNGSSICSRCQKRLLSGLSSAPQPVIDNHNREVQSISSAVRNFYNRKEKFRIAHGSTNSTRPKSSTHVVNTGPLSNVLHVDTASRTALVEPNVPMDRLVEATLKHGLIPPVVMEFPGITVGGGYAGTSGESSSFKHGFFNHTINSIEMVLADGEVVTASPTENSDLFYGGAGALGTLGVTTLVNLRLIPASKYVETTYHPVSSVPQATETVRSFTADKSHDYIDGILYSQNTGAVVTGKLTNSVSNHTIQRFSDAKDPWFYLHVQEMLEKARGAPVTEAIPIAEYLFRYDRGGFWVGRSAFDYFNFPFNSFTRWWLDDFLHTRMMYKALHASGQSKRYIVQDLAVPYENVEEFIRYATGKFGIWPLWLCPLKQSPVPTMHPHHVTKTTGEQKEMLNVGLWGNCPSHLNFADANRELEAKLKELGAMKWMYAQTYYTETEFWEMHDKEWYDALRRKYRATSLPSVYEKVKIAPEDAAKEQTMEEKLRETWPISGFYGIKKAIDSGLYLDARKSAWKQM